jgi:hypothetical protein
MIAELLIKNLESRLVNPVAAAENILRSNLDKENSVRVIKRRNGSCPYESVDGLCKEKSIRCGERQLYYTEEHNKGSSYIKNIPHVCNYNPSEQKHFMVVHNDITMREMLANMINCIYPVEGLVDVAESYSAAESLLKKGKSMNKQYALIISGIDISGNHGSRWDSLSNVSQTGYALANLLIERNYNSRILLIAEVGIQPMQNYMGDEEIIPGQKAVWAVINNKDFGIEVFEKQFSDIMSSFN